MLKTCETELEVARSETNRAKFVLTELNTRAHATCPTAPVEDSTVEEKLKWVEKAGSFATKVMSVYGTWCSWVTMRMLSLLLRGKGCSHISPSTRADPAEVTALSGAGSGLNSSRRDADDFTGKV
uniref:Uncharacterized protein n=1 Tax=Oryza punctata TaxID=4537 RepID=A0A0E0LJ63_ORYPU